MGNPGPRYAGTRHNVGFQTIDWIAEKQNIRFKKSLFNRFYMGRGIGALTRLVLIKPLTYMNQSGDILRDVLRKTDSEIRDLLVVCDTLDLLTGCCRLKIKGSAGGQKGLASIIDAAGTEEIPRISIGIGRPQSREDVVPFVLSKPTAKERRELDLTIDRISENIIRLLDTPIERVMNDINQQKQDSD